MSKRPGHEASGRSGAEWEEQKDERGERMMIRQDSKGPLGIVDAIVFDCDGVLVDVRGSYDASILRTTQTIVKDFAGATLPLEGEEEGEGGGELILQIRRTGGFNSDWDITYALTLFSIAAMTAVGDAALSQSDGTGRAIGRLKEIVTGFSSRERLAGWREVDAYLENEGLGSETVEKLRGYLKYPGNPLCSPMTATFDQMYYGGALFREIYGVEPPVWYEKGLIDEERVLISRQQLDRLMGLLGGGKRMAMATGRPFVAVEHTLRHLLSYFDLDVSVFIGDGDINLELRGELEKYRKPSGASLIRAQERFASRTLLYIGDSAEDRLMVRDAAASMVASAAQPNRILFAGIYGTSFNEEEQLSYFTTNRSDLVVKGVDRIPKILEGLRDR